MSLCIFFADDSRQQNPTRPGMKSLVAAGALCIPSERVRDVGLSLEGLCSETGLPSGEEFKWSPGRELWMHDNLTGERRNAFFQCVSEILEENLVTSAVIIEDISYRKATAAATNEMDVTALLIERIESQCIRRGVDGLIIADRPSGGRGDEDKFLSSCLETLQSGTDYVKPRHIIHNVVSTPSKLSRLVQAADFITSCTLAFVSGESIYSPVIFPYIKPLFDCESGRIGGVGLKLHPDFKFVNLYHWLVDDDYYKRGSSGYPLPNRNCPYYNDAMNP